MEVFNSRRVTNIGVVMTLYAAASLLGSVLSGGRVQLDLCGMLILLCAFNADHIISVTLGALIVNIFSTPPYDIIFGTAAVLISAALIYALRKKINLFVLSLIPVILNMAALAAGSFAESGDAFKKSMVWDALGEFVCITLVGAAVLSAARKNKDLMKLITTGHENGLL